MLRLLPLALLLSLTSAEARSWITHVLRPPLLPPGAVVPEPRWFPAQKLDHFSSDSRTWSQRYFVNDTFWDPSNGPVFLMLGGEGPADPAWLVASTEIMKNSQKYSALVVSLEHRYYGESRPTPDASLTNLYYLSSRQALMDAVLFKQYLLSLMKMTDNNRWVSFGGSYSGALAAWLRLLYPGTVGGGVATSGPVLAKVNFYEYLEVVNASLAGSKQGGVCVDAIQKATYLLDSMLADRAQWPVVEKLFSVSPPLQNYDDVANLAEDLAGNFMGVVQYNRDNTAFEGRANNITITDLCAIMANESMGPPLQRYAAVNSFLLKVSGEDTVDANFSAEVEFMKQSAWESPAVEGGVRQWTYQTCTEFGFYQTTDSARQPFGDLISLPSQLKTCSLVYGVSPANVSQHVASANAYYGGTDIPKNATNIIFPNGSIDPWHALGITWNISESLVAVFIQGTAHCANMYPARSTDLPSLVAARETISHTIGQWLVK